MKNLQIETLLFIFLTILSCKDSEKMPYITYYYPWTTSNDTAIYVYEDQEMNLGTQYHFMYQVETDSGNYVEKIIYDDAFQPTIKTREKRLKNGYLMVKYLVFDENEKGGIDTVYMEIIEGQAFYFGSMDENETLVQHYRINNIDTSAHKLIFIKNLQYAGEGVMEVQGIEYPTLNVKITGEIEDIRVGSLVLPLHGKNIYAEGLGCVRYKQTIQNKISYDYLYKGKLSQSEWRDKLEVY